MHFNRWPDPFMGALPAGTYRMADSPWPTGRIPSNVTISGAGADITAIVHDRGLVLEPGACNVTIADIGISTDGED